MSWWPFSVSGADAKARPHAQQSPAITTTTTAQTPSPASTSNPPPSSAPLDPDFYTAHPHLSPPSLSTPSAPSASSTTLSPTPATDTSLDEDSDSSLPRTMSCRTAFDSAFYCSSLGGHFNDIYRYGQLRSCSEHWNDFWFCMRTKNSYSGADVKERMVQERYREKEERLKAGPNSEDVWERRRAGEEVRGAFGARQEDGT
ncbi:Nn.00g046580.m01.CDS01 [Neocucurbitaria sp. VM-36]